MARISIDLDRTLGTVDRRVFGGFTEHMGRCIYGGVFDEGSPLADERGFRSDVLDSVRGLGMPVLRYPGGNFVSGYHWTDGIGPKDQRPRRPDLAWGLEESNRFGTDEFMEYCRELGAEPCLCLNMGTGTLDEALAWVDYCNGSGNTYWANKRRENGHGDPYNVRYWCLGNELYGDWQLGQLTADEYVGIARRWAKALRRYDPDLVLIGCGENGYSDWDRRVIEGLVRHIDFHSVHIYTGTHDYWGNVLAPHQAERALHTSRTLIDRARYVQRVEHPVHVAYDEWNVWFRTNDSQLDERYTLADALAVATYLNIFVRHCDTVRMANLAQVVNVIAPIATNPSGLFHQTIYHPIQLASQHTQEIAVDAFADCETVSRTDSATPDPWPHRIGDMGPFAVLDVAATRDAARRRVVVSVVNRKPDEAVRASLALTGASVSGEIVSRTVHGDKPEAQNSFDSPDTVGVTERRWTPAGGELDYEFPPHSTTQLDIQVG